MYSNTEELTALRVTTYKPVAVFGGCDCIDIPDNTNYCDHVIEQVRFTGRMYVNHEFTIAMFTVIFDNFRDSVSRP